MNQRQSREPMLKILTYSLRSRLIAANLAMLFPLLILTLVGYLAFERVIASFDEVLFESLNELAPINQLENSIQRAVTPLHGYLIHGARDEHRQFREIAAEIDQLFKQVGALKSLGPEQRTILQGAEKEWYDNLKLAEKIMAYKPPFGTDAAVMMELFDLRLNKLNSKLKIVRSYVDQEIIELNKIAKIRYRKNYQFSMLIFSLSAIIAVVIGIQLGRSIVRPLKKLEQAAEEFSQGNMSSRVVIESTDEIGNLASTFNTMAQEIENLVIHDPLTELLNKREFDKRLKHEITRARRYEKPVSMLMIDIDLFKRVNDSYGHQVGDIVLHLVSKLIAGQVRSIDHVARYGGEELVVIMPEMTNHDARKKAESIRQSIEQQQLFYNESDYLQVTVSIGVATFPQDANDPDELVAAADKALYVAKREGRNRVEAYQ